MDSYQEADNRGREKFDKSHGKDLITEHNQDPTGRWDTKATAITKPTITYVIEIKNIDRPSFKFPDFMIDYDKIEALVDVATAEGRRPIVSVFFSDREVVWNINKTKWRERKETRKVNKDGQHYGREYEYHDMTYLHFDEAVWTSTVS